MSIFEILSVPVLGGIVGFAVWYIQSRIERLQRAQERLRDERRKIYLDALEPIVRSFAGVKNPNEAIKAQKQMASFDYKRTALEFNLIGSDEVVRAFNRMMQHVYGNGEVADEASGTEMLRLWGQLLLAVRKNVGEPDSKLTEIDMLEAQISDIGNLLAPDEQL